MVIVDVSLNSLYGHAAGTLHRELLADTSVWLIYLCHGHPTQDVLAQNLVFAGKRARSQAQNLLTAGADA